MEPTLDQLRQNYKKMPDKKLVELATNQASSLRPEALEILKEEIASRRLSENVFKGIETQFREISKEEFKDYCEIVRSAPCPLCSQTKNKLNAILTSTTVSFLIVTTTDKTLHIACQECLTKLNKKAFRKSITLGWWGFPWGLIKTIQSLDVNNSMAKECNNPNPSNILISFISQNIGLIEANRDNKAGLLSLISNAQLN